MKHFKFLWMPLLVVLATCGLVGWTAGSPWRLASAIPWPATAHEYRFATNVRPVVGRIDALFARNWQRIGIEPAAPADDLQLLRRLSLALFGTIPSLEDTRQFEADTAPDRLHRWMIRMLLDDRFNQYFAERMAVAFIGDRANDFPTFRRERFEAWLSSELRAGTPYDEMVRRAITGTGQVTVSGEPNFIMAEISQGDEHANRLAGRVARAFLGQRIDCAECHDHPFAEWKQEDFQGLAAFFAQTRHSVAGVFDDSGREHQVENHETLKKHVIAPRVPFQDKWLGNAGSRRERLATWVTHSDNRRFRRAIANRVWGLLFGRPFITPVDDLPNPPQVSSSYDGLPRPSPTHANGTALEGHPTPDVGEPDETELLDILGDDLAAHGFDLRRLVLIVASARPFQIASTHEQGDSLREYHTLTDNWAAFPLVQLRPEQISRSMQQLQTVSTLHLDSDALSHTYRAHWMREFSEQYGSLGELELDEQSSSIQQTIVRMTGRFTQQSIRPELRHATTRIAAVAQDDAECVDACFLVCLTRRPTIQERRHFVSQLQGTGRKERLRIVEDMFWSMLNCSEFAWNH